MFEAKLYHFQVHCYVLSFVISVNIRFIGYTTKFVNLKFNDIYIHSAVFGADNIQRLDFILQHANHQPGCILRNKTDKLLVKPMIEAIVREDANRNLYSKEIIILPEEVDECSEGKSLDILQYIQTNIYQSDKIKTKVISQYFGISPSYLGRYFKKHTHETMQQYILDYKLNISGRIMRSSQDEKVSSLALYL